MGGVVTAQGVDERAVADKPVLVYMAGEMHELVDHVGHGRRANKKPTDICGHHEPEQTDTGDRYQDKDHQCIRRKKRDPPIGLVSKAQFSNDPTRHRSLRGISFAPQRSWVLGPSDPRWCRIMFVGTRLYPPIGLVSKAHFLIGKEPVMIQRMAIVNGAESLPLTRFVHDIAMQVPLEDVAAHADHRDRQPLPPLDIL